MASEALITMKSTQLKKSRKWNSMMLNIRIPGSNGPFNPPSFSHMYKLKVKKEDKPLFEDLYKEVAAGNEAQKSIDSNSKDDYREKLEIELAELRDSEMWQAGKIVRTLRPESN